MGFIGEGIVVRARKKWIRFRRGTRWKIWAFLLLAAIIAVFLDSQIRPVLRTAAVQQGKAQMTAMLNDAVTQMTEGAQLDCMKMVQLSRDESGEIRSVETNTLEMNRLQAQLSSGLNQSLQSQGEGKIKIPVGTLTGLALLNGHGPDVVFRSVFAGYAETKLSSRFSQAGINQTLLQVSLTVTVNAEVILPGADIPFSVGADYILADAVIVGSIPQDYANISGDGRSSLEKYNDYVKS